MAVLDIFAGPIVRRASVEQVCIWVAVKGKLELAARLYDGDDIIGANTSEFIIAGALSVHLIKIRPSAAGRLFPAGKLIRYDLGVSIAEVPDYADFRGQVLEHHLSYENESWYVEGAVEKNTAAKVKIMLPGFFIQETNSALNAVFGSCRKPHDKGEDAYVKLDQFLMQTCNTLDKRPTVLFLGGDQIYADDVEKTALFPKVLKLAEDLLLNDVLPESGAVNKRTYANRAALLKKLHFTSGELATHLMGFGEYVAMYGLVWNASNWDFVPLAALKDFYTGLAATRRVMANTACYMNFDDHDITDDWFITNRNRQEVLNSRDGTRIIANAMAAFFLFQGWGNNPSTVNFSAVKQVIENHLSNPADANAAAAFDKYFLLQGWEFAAPTNPVSYFLNTRTERDGYDFPPILKSKSSWDKSRIIVANKNFPFILVTAGPLITFPQIDIAQTGASALVESAVTGNYGADNESWHGNGQNYQLLFNYFQSHAITKVVVLSGDVHYAYSAIFSLINREQLLGQAGAYEIKALQITSSAMKNSAGPLAYLATVPYPGTLYYLMFDQGMVLAPEKASATNLLYKKPEYYVDGNMIYKRQFSMGLINTYSAIAAVDYPKLILKFNIKSAVPKTAGYYKDHNFGSIKIQQNSVEYSFNNGETYNYSL